MTSSSPPKPVAVDIIAAQPAGADSAAIAHLSATARKPLPEVAYVVKVRLESVPEATSQGWALYVGDFRIPKYWGSKDGIYFKVFDPQFLDDHQGQPLRFSQNGTDFTDTGLTLPAPRPHDPAKLPLLDDVLK